VHIAGTNGKGSTSIKTHSLLAHSGFKAGLFTTPSISSLREVIKINNEMISESDFCKYYDIIEKFEKDWDVKHGYFQCMLAMGMLYFKDQGCDYVVLECGIGGFHSQTNFFDSDYAAITSIGFDHMDVLGKT
jgi:dihydrofolate synthase/folylpolyglutamate synthase